jgi:hypothetical protein
MTAGEKIGLIFSVFVCLGVAAGRDLFEKILERIQPRYLKFPQDSSTLPKRGDVHFFSDQKPNSINGPMDRTRTGVTNLVKQVVRHDLTFFLDAAHQYDELQTEYFLHAVHKYLNVPWSFSEARNAIRHRNFTLSEAEKSCAKEFFTCLRKDPTCQQPNPRKKKKIEDIVEYDDLPTNIPKHNIVRPKVKGDGPTSCILTDVIGFRNVLQRGLCFHSLIHYFEEVVGKDGTIDIEVIRRRVAEYVEEYSRVIYRGDDSVDCNTCKMHAHLHLSEDIDEYGHPMNWEAGKGERGLKVWAKLASRTALKQSISVFTHQTALRVSEDALLSKMKSLLPVRKATTVQTERPSNNRTNGQCSLLNRAHPHFLFDLRTKKTTIHTATVVQRKLFNETESIIPDAVMNYLRTMEGRDGTLKIWRDATISIGDDDEKKIQKDVRACSIYDKYGPFFDWVQVQWKTDNTSNLLLGANSSTSSDTPRAAAAVNTSGQQAAAVDTSGSPAKVLLIYEDRNNELCFIVHACNWRSIEEKKERTLLTSRWSLEYTPSTKKTAQGMKQIPSKIILRKVKVGENISKILYVMEHGGEQSKSMGVNVPQVCSDQRKYVCDVINRRFEWAFPFLS